MVPSLMRGSSRLLICEDEDHNTLPTSKASSSIVIEDSSESGGVRSSETPVEVFDSLASPDPDVADDDVLQEDSDCSFEYSDISDD